MTENVRSRARRRGIATGLSTIVCVALIGAGTAASAGTKQFATPKKGEWSSATEGPHSAGGTPIGGWDVGIASDGALKILPHNFGLASGIVPPYWRKCTDNYVPMLPAGTEIPIHGGKFNYAADYDLAGRTMHLHWRGHWTTRKRVKGDITLNYHNCNGTRKWAGAFGKLPPNV